MTNFFLTFTPRNQQAPSTIGTIMAKMPVTILLAAFVLTTSVSTAWAQKLDPDDRIGGQTDMCEELRFKRITALLESGQLTEQEAYERWKRITSDTVAVKALLDEAATAGELTPSQVERLMPLLAMEFVAKPHSRRPSLGNFGVNKALPPGTFEDNEVSQENRDKVFQRLVAANKAGVIYDFDVSSIMAALYTGWDWRQYSAEQEYVFRRAINPRIMQAEEQGTIRKEGMLARYQQKRDALKGGRRGNDDYGKAPLKIEDPSAWQKELGKPIFSGPQLGEKLPPFEAVAISGANEGEDFDAVALAGDKLHLLIFAKEARTFGRFLPELAKQVGAIDRNSKQPWAMSFIVVNDDPNDVEKKFEALKRRYPDFVEIGLSKDGSDGPPAYGLDRNMTATVIVAKDGKVLYNLPYPSDAFYSQPHILGALAGAMEVEHEELRTLIGDLAGDQVTGVSRRRAMREKEDGAEQDSKAPINSECPVTGEAVTGESPTMELRGRVIAICCEKCKSKIEADPQKYADVLRRK